jgi:putative transposase
MASDNEVGHDVRDQVVDTLRCWAEKTELTLGCILSWAEIHSSTFCKWTRCYGKAYERNAKVPRDHWLTDAEKQAIIKFHLDHPLIGYRRLTYMMMDANVVACSPSTVHRVLSAAGLLARFNKKASKKGTGFDQPIVAHNQRLHSAIGYVTPSDMLAGKQKAIHEERDRKLEAARAPRAPSRC